MKRKLAFGGIFFLSVATLMFEINLTRLFSVAQFYHFAFMIISLAMLGFGSSGTLLALFPRFGRRRPSHTLAWLALGYALTSAGAYALTNFLPFDSFSIAWDRQQVFILLLHYLALSLPFFCSGVGLSLMFVLYPQSVGYVYATNLTGSAVGCLLALLAPAVLGGEGIVWLSALFGGVCALLFFLAAAPSSQVEVRGRWGNLKAYAIIGMAVGLIMICTFVLVWDPVSLALRLSPYKSLSYALQFPDARIIFQRWNSFSRVDVVESDGIRSLPGLSYRYLASLPPQLGLFVDGGQLNPIVRSTTAATAATATTAATAATATTAATAAAVTSSFTFTDFLPEAVAYQLRPDADTLVLGSKGGLALWDALAQGASEVTAVEGNPLVVEAVGPGSPARSPYTLPQVKPVLEHPRSFVRRKSSHYDVVVLALTSPYQPVRSGAYSLAEDYGYTVEAFEDYLACLKPEGIFVTTRWLQMPPSESLRTFALAVTALEQRGGEPARQVVAFRGYATLTILVKVEPFTSSELAALRRFTRSRAFDLVYAPDISDEEVNQFNVLDEPLYYLAFRSLLEAEERDAWYAAYTFDVTPPTDNHPFFGHFFKWSQAGQVLAELGKQWQPFGGVGYFVLVVLLALALLAAMSLILVPLLVVRGGSREKVLSSGKPQGLRMFPVYFALLGLGYLLVEIPLMQQFILFLGHPAYSMTSVLFALLLFSGLGSAYARDLEAHGVLTLPRALLGLIVVVTGYALGLRPLFGAALGLSLLGRMGVAVLAIAPLGFLMGIPFPGGIRRLEAYVPRHIAWTWGINGAVSVVASVLAALLALSFGFQVVLVGGALCYVGAWVLARRPW
jgi:hypothetical protein